MKNISIKINGKSFSAEEDQSILDVATKNNIEIPSLCYHPDIEVKQHCGMCLVEIDGISDLQRACGTKVEDGMEILTESEKIYNERKNNLDLILEKHLLECDDCVWFQHCKLLDLVRQFKAIPLAEKNKKLEVLQSESIVFDQTKCIGCENCISVCPTKYLEMNEMEKLTPSSDEKIDCIDCGQCILHCPVGAIEGVGEFEELENFFKKDGKTTVVQFAPSIRTSIGEEFDMRTGTIATGKLVAGLKQIGFDYVFDTASGADFTTMEESNELIERLEKNENLPAMSSCCPAWVKFIEFNYPEFVKNLCTSRSPQMMLGGIIKNYWSKTVNIDPKNLYVVSIMPCVAKKSEIKREALLIDGQRPVDCILTTRELARLFKKKRVDLKNINEEKADDPLGSPSGAGVIYGSSGGVFESALRTAYFKMTDKEMPFDAVEEIRGSEGVKIKEIQVKDRTIKICVVNGVKNARGVLEDLKKNPKLYDAVEVMACPGGCVGGGGQPVPTTKEIVKKRSQALYKIDADKKVRCAHNNPTVVKIYSDFFSDEKTRKKILHTHFEQSTKTKIKKLKNSRETYE